MINMASRKASLSNQLKEIIEIPAELFSSVYLQ